MIQRFLQNRNGVALIEFVIVLPVLLVLMMGLFELTRYIVIIQKVEKSLFAVSNIATQLTPPSSLPNESDISSVTLREQAFRIFRESMRPYGANARRALVFTSVRKEMVGGSEQLRLRWQMGRGQLGGVVSSVNQTDIISRPPVGPINNMSNEAVSLTDIALKENVIVTEIFYQYDPLFAPILENLGINIQPKIIRRMMFTHPRNGDLLCLPQRYPVCT